MFYAKRSNVIINIFEQDIKKYLDLGYDITDLNGKVLYEAVPNDTPSLKRAFVRHTRQIKTQKQQIEQLQAMVKELTVKLEDLTPKTVQDEVPAKPKRTRKTTVTE